MKGGAGEPEGGGRREVEAGGRCGNIETFNERKQKSLFAHKTVAVSCSPV